MTEKLHVLSPAQRKVALELEPFVQLSVSGLRSGLPFKPRTHTLLVGPSGAGKSHLATTLASQAAVPLWRENVSNWCPMGARGNPTFPALIRWIQSVDRGIIFLDEIDKLNSESEYSVCIRTEIFSLLDSTVPNSALAVAQEIHPDPFDGRFTAEDRQLVAKVLLEQKLKNHVFILGAGAWQQAWEKRKTRSIGFIDAELHHDELIARESLLRTITPELLQRFRRDISYLEPMSEHDYLEVLDQHLKVIPELHRTLYESMIREVIPVALRDGLGMRIFEEVYSGFCATLLRQVCYDDFVFKDITAPARSDR